MGASRPQRPAARAGVVGHMASGDPAATERAIDSLVEAANRSEPKERTERVIDLVVGVNRITTGLGRKARGCNLTPTVADASFAWAFAVEGDRQVLITVIGVAQPACPLEFY